MGALQSTYFKHENAQLDTLLAIASELGCSIVTEESFDLNKIEITYRKGDRQVQTSFLLNKNTNYDTICDLVQNYIDYIKKLP